MKQENLQKAIALRHELHRHPELSGAEEWTREHLEGFLRRNTSLRIVHKGRWFYAWYDSAGRVGGHENDREDYRRADSGDGLGDDNGREDRQVNGSAPGYKPAALYANKPGIAFRADFDALPIQDGIDADYRSVNEGVGHKCGHDGHAATLAALALEVDGEGADRDVFFLFQHAEETGEGRRSVWRSSGNTGSERFMPGTLVRGSGGNICPEGEALLYPVGSAWELYPPVGLPGESMDIVLPGEDNLMGTIKDEIGRLVRKELLPIVDKLKSRMEGNGVNPRVGNQIGILYARYGGCWTRRSRLFRMF